MLEIHFTILSRLNKSDFGGYMFDKKTLFVNSLNYYSNQISSDSTHCSQIEFLVKVGVIGQLESVFVSRRAKKCP